MIDEVLDVEENNVSIEMIFSDGVYSTPEDFSIHIEKLVVENGGSYLETIMEYLEDNDLEPESIAKSLTSSLREKLQAECEGLNLLTTKSPRLPE